MKQLLEIEKTSDADHNDGEEQLVLELLRAGQLLQLVQRIQGVQPDFRSQKWKKIHQILPGLAVQLTILCNQSRCFSPSKSFH